jgi:hypothetical protein
MAEQNLVATNILTYGDHYVKEFNRRLACGKDLYGWRMSVTRNNKTNYFVVAMDCIGGRGLRIANTQPVPIGECLTVAAGVIFEGWKAPDGDEFKWLISKPTETKMGKYLILQPPTWDKLGNIINTSDGSVKNNCRLQHKAGNAYLSVVTTAVLYPGDELLVPYGRGFTGAIHRWLRCEEYMLDDPDL